MEHQPHPQSGPDIDVLADLSADLLGNDRSARAHVDGCAECSAVLAALEQTGADLRWLPPIAMPPAVVARIEGALAEENKVVSLDQLRTRRQRRHRLLSVAAAGLVVLGGGGVLIAELTNDPSDAQTTAATSDQNGGPDGAQLGPDLDETTLPGAVADLVVGGQGDQPRLEGTPAAQDCVAAVQIEGVDELIGVIEIRYGGRARDAVFFRTSDPTVARVIVVDDCSSTDPEIEKILTGQL